MMDQDPHIPPQHSNIDAAAERDTKLVYIQASKLADHVANELGRGAYLPSEREALYLALQLSAVVEAMMKTEATSRSTLLSPLVLWDYKACAPHDPAPKSGSNEARIHWNFEVDHALLLTFFVRQVRTELQRESDLGIAQHNALVSFINSFDELSASCIRSLGRSKWITVEEAVGQLTPPPDPDESFASNVQTHKEFGLVSLDCEEVGCENSHSELVRVSKNEAQNYLHLLVSAFNVELAPDLSLYGLKNARALFQEARLDGTTDDAATKKGIAYAALNEILQRLREAQQMPTLDAALDHLETHSLRATATLERCDANGLSDEIKKAALTVAAYYQYVLREIPAHREFLRAALEC